MGQIVRRKKKGRPPRPDPSLPPETERDVRRSLRRRNVKYVFDLDDYFDEDEVLENDEEQRRRDKKLKRLLKLQTGELRSTAVPRRVDHAPALSTSSSDSGEKPSKKRKIIDEIDEDVDDENDEDNYNKENDDQITRKKSVLVAEYSNPGTPADGSQGAPLPEKKTLELILDKLQKKDIYGVYAEPVDPEELPDYHDVIKQPMDFATMRKKLGNGSYETLEQFESDVFLICSNAMTYNAPDTIYHKQAHSIKELAIRKFQKIRSKSESSEKNVKPEQKLRSPYLAKRPAQGSVMHSQQPPSTDFSSAKWSDCRNVSNSLQDFDRHRPGNASMLPDGIFSSNDNAFDKGDESLPGKGPMSRFGKKATMHDENRRETYSVSLAHNAGTSESMFSTFDGDSRQLVPVGIYSEDSYARSLARFAATLGSAIWEIASKRIEKALPQGLKYGRGWVGEYEPPPTPVLIIENCNVKEPPFFTKVKPATQNKYGSFPLSASPDYAHLPFLDRSGIASCSTARVPAKEQYTRVNASDMGSSFLLASRVKAGGSANMINQHQISQFRGSMDTDQKALNQFKQKAGPQVNRSAAEGTGHMQSREMYPPKSREFAKFSTSEISKQPDNGIAVGALPNGRVLGRFDGDNITSSSMNMTKASGYLQQEQGHVMRMQSLDSHPQILPSAPISSRNGPAMAAAAAAARAWMSVGAGGFRPPFENSNTPPGNPQPQVAHFRGQFASNGGMVAQSDRNYSLLHHPFAPQGPPTPLGAGNALQFQNQQMVYPQAASDLSRFQLPPTWRGLSPQMHSRQKQESLPPDLNIGFQSSGSPGGPSSGILVDSQQPDLALQL